MLVALLGAHAPAANSTSACTAPQTKGYKRLCRVSRIRSKPWSNEVRSIRCSALAVLGIECHERFPPPSRKSILANSSKHSLFSFAVASGLVLWLTSATPVGAGWFNFPDQPHYVNWGQSQAPKLHRKPRREISSHKHEAQREQRRPQGPFQVIVTIASQQVSLYGQDGFIERAPISTGMSAHPTPTGVFTVIAKARWHASNIYSRAPMPYMQRITWSGIALHAGPRPGYPASHGCIRLPQDFAVRLFQMTKIGTRVIVTRDAVAPIEITHPKLFVPKKPAEHTAALAADLIKGAIGIAADTPAAEHPSASAGTTSGGNTAVESKSAVGLPQPVSVFVSRKQRKVFVRRGFEELFDLPIRNRRTGSPDRHSYFHGHGIKGRRQSHALDRSFGPKPMTAITSSARPRGM